MAIKDIFLPLVGEPEATAIAAIDKCVAVAGDLGAWVTAMAVEEDIPIRPTVIVSNDLDNTAAVEAVRSVSLVPVKADDDRSERIVERLIFESGRPILMCPEEFASELPVAFDDVVIAWDHTAPAARAVADALPILQSAANVRIVTATDDKTTAELASGAALVSHLAEHGITATFETVKIDGSSVGKAFEAYVKARAINLLVMGAYRHSRLSEIVWGGATKTVIGRPPCWVMMSH